MARSLCIPLVLVSLAFTAVFMLAIGVIHAQPYDDGGVSAFLFDSPGCENIPDDKPCFMGIRPGITTFDEAAALLDAHQWVESVSLQRPIIHWTWNGQQPQFIGFPQERGLASISGDTVRRLYVGYTSITISDLWLTFDQPASFDIATSRAFVDFGTSYTGTHLTTQMIVSCPLRVADFWMLKVNIAFEDEIHLYADDFRFPDLCRETGFLLIG